jgi:hypothetical protein
MQTFTLPGFSRFLAEMAIAMPLVEHLALDQAAAIVQAEAKRVLGTYDYGWIPLAPATRADRVAQGYPADEPGLRSGDMRESIERQVSGDQAQVGSNDDHLVWFELGTVRQPPRSVLAEAARRKSEAVADTVGRVLHAHLKSGGTSAAGHPFNEVSFTVL